MYFTPLIYVICVITIIYASFSTLRTIDVKELIAYSSVAHAAVYLMGSFSNSIQGIEGAIALGLGHGFVSSAAQPLKIYFSKFFHPWSRRPG